MCHCGCTIRRNPTIGGRNTYNRYPIRTPQTAWHLRANRPSFTNYVSNGSYAGRNRRTPCNGITC